MNPRNLMDRSIVFVVELVLLCSSIVVAAFVSSSSLSSLSSLSNLICSYDDSSGISNGILFFSFLKSVSVSSYNDDDNDDPDNYNAEDDVY